MTNDIIEKSAVAGNDSILKSSDTRTSINRIYLVDAYRKHVQKKWQTPLQLKCQQMLLAGKYPFEKGWRTEYEIAALKEMLRKRNRAILFDLILVFGLALILNILLLVIIFLVIDAA